MDGRRVRGNAQRPTGRLLIHEGGGRGGRERWTNSVTQTGPADRWAVEEEERQLCRTVVSESLRSSWALWKVSGRQYGKQWRQPRGSIEEDFHTLKQ